MVTKADFDLMDKIKKLEIELSRAQMAIHSHGIVGFELGRLTQEKLQEVIKKARRIGGDSAYTLIEGINGGVSVAQVISFFDAHPTFEQKFSGDFRN